MVWISKGWLSGVEHQAQRRWQPFSVRAVRTFAVVVVLPHAHARGGLACAGLHLAFTGAIKDEIMDIENLAFRFIDELNKRDINILKNRYNLSEDSYEDTLYLMDEIGRNRGAILKKNEIDYFKVANLVFDDFRKVKLGRITLETVEDIEKFEEDNGN